jgi:hypothetical protein
VIDPVAKAATVSTSTPGFRMNLGMQIDIAGLGSVTGTGSGAFDTRPRSGAMDLRMQLPDVPQIAQVLGSRTLAMREIVHGLTIYIHMPAAISSHLPGGRPWMKLDLGKAAAAMGMPGLSSLAGGSPLSNDPTQMLQFLRAVSGGVTTVGHDTVAGYPTTHYRATIDFDKVADHVPAGQRAAIRKTVQTLETLAHVKRIPVEVWVDNSSLVRRFAMHMTMSLPTGSAMGMAMQFTIPEYGPQPQPALPPAGQVTDLGALMHAGTTGAASATS